MTIDLSAWERHITLQDGSGVFLRPIRPDDQKLYARFFELETPDDIRFRFFGPVKRRDPNVRFTPGIICLKQHAISVRRNGVIVSDRNTRQRELAVTRIDVRSPQLSGDPRARRLFAPRTSSSIAP